MTARDEIDWRRRGRTGPDPAPGASPARRSSPEPSPITVAGRLRIARGVPQAVLKILSYRRGRDAVRRTLAYVVGKAGERFVVEGDVELDGPAARAALLDDWSRDFSTRVNGRDVAHLEVSAPPGSDRSVLLAAARDFAGAAFGATHQYALSEHRDTAHPHVHLILKLRGHDGRMLDPRKAVLAEWRAMFARAARTRGLMLDASPRIARGAPPKNRSRAALERARRNRTAPPDVPPMTTGLRERLAVEGAAFHRAALQLARAVDAECDPAERERFRGFARELVAFGDRLGSSRSRASEQGPAPSRRDVERGD